MRLSREKINHLSHLILQELKSIPEVRFLIAENDVRLQVVRSITEELKIEESIDEEVRRTLRSYSRKIIEGSREWDVMYQKLYEQEMNKRMGWSQK
ncbi:MAG: DUF507 family protein [Nitrospinota bacterium]|nr:MAG: DUF507 family protein [Nitrospinota bacterium]